MVRLAVVALALVALVGACAKDSDQRLRASASSTSSTAEPSTTTTAPAVTVTAGAPVTSPPAPSTTTTTRPPATTTTAKPAVAPDQASVTLVNDFSAAVDLKVNGRAWRLNAGQRIGPVGITPAASGNDVVEVARADTPSCGVGDADSYFQAGRRYTLSVVAQGDCGKPAPGFTVSPA